MQAEQAEPENSPGADPAPVAWIRTVDPAELPSAEDGEADSQQSQLAQLYSSMLDPHTGQLDHIMRVHSLHPAGLSAHDQLYRAVMRGTKSLRKVDRELIALVTSKLNGCHY